MSVCRSVAIMSPAKTAELIEMPFWMWTRVAQRTMFRWGSVPEMTYNVFSGTLNPTHFTSLRWGSRSARVKGQF